MHENSLAPMTLSRPAGRDAIEGAYTSLQSADHLVGGVGWSVGPAVLRAAWRVSSGPGRSVSHRKSVSTDGTL